MKSLLVSARSITLKIVAGTIFVTSILSGASPAAADTNGQLTYTVADGKASVTGCDGACSASIAVPSTLGGVPVAKIADWAFYDQASIETVSLPSSVTTIGTFAFAADTGLESINIPTGVTEIATYALYLTPKLQSIELPEGLVSIGSHAFSYAGFRSITIPATVTSIGDSAFYVNSYLENVNFEGNAPSVDAYAFDALAANPKANLASRTLTGYGNDGDDFHGLTVTYPAVPPTISGAPTGPTKSRSATFSLAGDPGATFKCSVDGGSYTTCTSPLTTSGLSVGDHVLRVTQARGTGSDSAPASVTWTVTELDAPSLIGRARIKFNFSTRVTTVRLNAIADQSDGPNPITSIEYFSHPRRPSDAAQQNPGKIREYGTTVVLPAKEVAFWVRVKDTKGKWSRWYWTKK